MTAVCTAEAYDFSKLKRHLISNSHETNLVCDDVLHCRLNGQEVFFFENGSYVLWPLVTGSTVNDLEILDKIKNAVQDSEIGGFADAEMEELDVIVTDTKDAHFQGETIVLPKKCDVMTMLAFSNGLSDSVKLAKLESFLQKHISKVKHIPAMLQRNGRIDLTRAQVLKLIGELLHFRAVLNLHSELIDTPELYWSEPALEHLYLRTAKILETRTRISVLNKKLDYANEMAHLLRSHLSEQHSLKLEWGIIALIAVEVAFELAHYI